MADNLDPVIKTIIAEALGEGSLGQQMVAETIINRAQQRGLSPAEVVQQPSQYTGYWSPGSAAQKAFSDPNAITAAQAAWQLAQGADDPTKGANHYFNPNLAQPSWAKSMTPTTSYGGHAFYTDRPFTQQMAQSAPIPQIQSGDMQLMRNPYMSSTAAQQQVSPYPTNQSLDMLIRRTPGQTIATYPTGGANQQPTMLPTLTTGNSEAYNQAARRAALQANMTYAGQEAQQQGLTGGAAYSAALREAARKAALQANMSYAGQEAGGNWRNDRLPTGSPYQNYSVAANGPPGLTAGQMVPTPNGNYAIAPMPANMSAGLAGRRGAAVPLPGVGGGIAPMPLTASAGLQTRRNQGLPVAAAAVPGGVPGPAPLRVVVNGAGSYTAQPQQQQQVAQQPMGMTVVQALQATGMSPAQAYAAANAGNHMPTNAWERMEQSSGSGGASANSIYG